MPFDKLGRDAALYGILNAPPKEDLWRDPDAIEREKQATVDAAMPRWLQVLGAALSLAGAVPAGGAPAATAQGARRSARLPAGSQPTAAPGSGAGFRALSDAATRMTVEQAQKGQTAFPWGERQPTEQAERARAQLMEQYAPAFYGQSNRYANPNPTPDRYAPPKRQAGSMNPEQTSRVQVPKVASEDLAHELMAGNFDNAVMAYNPSGPASFGSFARQAGRGAAQEMKEQGSVVPQPSYNPVSRKIAALDREWGATHTGGPMPDAVVGRKLGMSPNEVRVHRAQMEREQTRQAESFDTLQHGEVAPSPMDRIDEIQDTGSKIGSIRRALAGMNERDKRVFLKYRDPDNPRSAAQIAAEEGVSRQMIDRIIKRTNKFIQDIHEGRGFPDIGGGSGAPQDSDWGSKPTRTRPLSPRELGQNPRANDQDPMAPMSQMSPRFLGVNPRFMQNLRDRLANFEYQVQGLHRPPLGEAPDLPTPTPRAIPKKLPPKED